MCHVALWGVGVRYVLHIFKGEIIWIVIMIMCSRRAQFLEV